jgi:hypothetical protein
MVRPHITEPITPYIIPVMWNMGTTARLIDSALA